MIKKDKKSQILENVIIGYRKVVDDRYQYKNLKDRKGFPDSFTEQRVEKFKSYFLNYVYPPLEKREILDEAFDSLDNFIKYPDKLMRVLIDSASLIFKYGKHLPKILRAGLKALKSFRSASKFEGNLVEKAIVQNQNPPYSIIQIEGLIKTLSRKEIDEFMESSLTLFDTLHDRTLVAKIKKIMDHLVEKMKKRPKIYSPAEIKGLEIGKEIIEKGDLLFEKLSTEEQGKIFTFIIDMEREEMDRIFG
ncbi:MAG: hypothetical protein ACJAT4_002234 [Granulosicoccus sp.]|jgi:hypothetical protein